MEVKVRNGPTDYHFSLPYLLNSQGQPDASSLHRRNFGEEDGVDTALKHDYVFSEADETLCTSMLRIPLPPGSLSFSRLRLR
jgi:hypothetical protein